MRRIIFLFLLVVPVFLLAEDGYDLWLRYKPVGQKMMAQYRSQLKEIHITGAGATIAVIKEELQRSLPGLLQSTPVFTSSLKNNGTLVIGTAASPLIQSAGLKDELTTIGPEGFIIATKIVHGKKCTVIAANTDVALLYGTFQLIRWIQTEQPAASWNIVSVPKLKLRMLNHWDNLDRTVERGYAGFSIWNWHTLPGYIDKRYKDYARANASLGINAVSLTNVNANATVLTTAYLKKVAALANTFRPYGIKVFLTARFSAPIEIGGLKTADPFDKEVQDWWKQKAKEIYSFIPDFGGFLVKANSEGQPGPQNYKRSHADGANMLADAVAPNGGIIIWRAFVYSHEVNEDRHKQAYNEFVPLDGSFKSNVMVQVKNGAIDFQPREPFHPLFGAMPKTPLMMEFQVTQEYLGQATNLVYLAPYFKECLQSDTYVKGEGSTVAKIIDGSLDHHMLNGMAGVANIGTDINWCGHPFAQANWYALGRLAWDYDLTSEQMAGEWLRMTFTNDPAWVSILTKMLIASREIVVGYMTPLGLHHLMGTSHHYGPAPWVNNLSREDWNPVYYHKADSAGIGFDRTKYGSNALSQYSPTIRNEWQDLETCPDKLLLWFHHLPWNFTMKNGNTLWNELCRKYYEGVDSVRWMQKTWEQVKHKVDKERADQVTMLLKLQEEEAVWWRNACLLYFQTFSGLPIPAHYEKPDKTLDHYKKLRFPFAPGI